MKEGFVMKLHKTISAILAALLISLPIAGCAGDKGGKVDDVTIRIGGLAGPTSIGLVKLMEDNEAGKTTNKYEFSVDASPDVITPKLVQGNLDIAAVPANLASVLYNNTDGKIQLLAINTLGVLYILTRNVQINSVADLRGKTIYASGKGATPEFSLRYILSENGIYPDKDVTIEWKSEHSEVVAALSTAGSGIAMLPQPFVTIARNTLSDLVVALDLTEEWNKIGGGTEMLTGVLVVRREFAEAHPAALAAFLDEYAASTEYVNKNVSEAAQLVGKFNIFNAAVAEAAIPHCNITFIGGENMKPLMEGYLKVLYDQKPASVGGKLPGDDFYYVSKVSD
jgi:NitT/TauT family transport system substrate-binding protein